MIPVYILYKLTSEGKMSFMLAFRDLLDNFAITLNIFNIFKIYSEDNQGNLTNTPHFYKGYYAIYKLYAIFILVLIYQLIVAIRRRVKR